MSALTPLVLLLLVHICLSAEDLKECRMVSGKPGLCVPIRWAADNLVLTYFWLILRGLFERLDISIEQRRLSIELQCLSTRRCSALVELINNLQKPLPQGCDRSCFSHWTLLNANAMLCFGKCVTMIGRRGLASEGIFLLRSQGWQRAHLLSQGRSASRGSSQVQCFALTSSLALLPLTISVTTNHSLCARSKVGKSCL